MLGMMPIRPLMSSCSALLLVVASSLLATSHAFVGCHRFLSTQVARSHQAVKGPRMVMEGAIDATGMLVGIVQREMAARKKRKLAVQMVARTLETLDCRARTSRG